jgi:hypothetical protein
MQLRFTIVTNRSTRYHNTSMDATGKIPFFL